MTDRPTTILRGRAAGARWLTAHRALHPALAGAVTRVVGYEEGTPAPMLRPELPGPTVTCIVEIGPPIAVDGVQHGGFLAGLHERPAVTVHDGWQTGVQIDLTPLGASRILTEDGARFAGRVVALDDVLPASWRPLGHRLAEVPDWAGRLTMVERFLIDRLTRTAPPPAWVDWAMRRIVRSGGRVPMAALADELGYTRRHVNRTFRTAVGVAPKRYALLVRFHRLVTLLDAGDDAPWIERAAAVGYADQAHLAREVRRFTGLTPTALLRLRRGHWYEDDVPSVQDG